jgi:hypothetical protein
MCGMSAMRYCAMNVEVVRASCGVGGVDARDCTCSCVIGTSAGDALRPCNSALCLVPHLLVFWDGSDAVHRAPTASAVATASHGVTAEAPSQDGDDRAAAAVGSVEGTVGSQPLLASSLFDDLQLLSQPVQSTGEGAVASAPTASLFDDLHVLSQQEPGADRQGAGDGVTGGDAGNDDAADDDEEGDGDDSKVMVPCALTADMLAGLMDDWNSVAIV